MLVTVREVNLAPLYAPVDHSLSNDNSYFRGDSLIVQRYCPYPVPEKYQISVTLHHVSWTLVGLIDHVTDLMACGTLHRYINIHVVVPLPFFCGPLVLSHLRAQLTVIRRHRHQ